MRIAMVSAHASPLAPLGDGGNGGINVHVAELARAMGLRGHEVTVYTRRDDAALPRRAGFGPNVTVVHLDAGPPRPLPKEQLAEHLDELARALESAVAEEPAFDIVHSHYWLSGVAADAALPSTAAATHVHTPHALGVARKRHPPHEVPELRLAREAELLGAAGHIVATSSDEVFELRRLGLRADRVTVVPSGVDLELFHPKGPVDLRRPGWSRVVVVGRLLARKGMRDVVRAMASVPSAELVIAGGPPREQLDGDEEARRLRDLAGELGVQGRVALRGRASRRDVASLLRSADVVVSVPHYEPFGTVPLEAMACGAAVITTPVGGLIDTVVDGVTGVHVPVGDCEALAEALNHLLAKPYWRLALGAGGAQRAHTRYGWPRIAESTLELYERLLRSARRATEAG